MVSCIYPFVHNEAVQIRILRNKPYVSCDDYGHMAHGYAFFAAVFDVGLQRFKIYVLFDEVTGVIPFVHDIGCDLIHRVICPDPVSVSSVH